MRETIYSRDNPVIKDTAKLASSPKERRERGLFVAEGIRLCRDAVISGAKIKIFFFTEYAYNKNTDAAELIIANTERSIEIPESVMVKICDTGVPQGFLCVIEMRKDMEFSPLTGKKYLALETIQDPSNLGTILRTAEALGIDGVILSRDCCDIYSPKVVRGSMGAVFRLPCKTAADFTDSIRSWSKSGISTYAAVPRNGTSIEKTDFSGGGIMLIGNEGNGLKEGTISCCTDKVSIVMKGRAESLNAAAAAAILLYRFVL